MIDYSIKTELETTVARSQLCINLVLLVCFYAFKHLIWGLDISSAPHNLLFNYE